ncbi:hypothetical protein H5410_023524 [Solanum commersonii]|uniref:Uncharacterized protein n=1 Tax=Solanum commersonii TaxID=4109 RepID=A0A9J5ZH42_SOLCO|nr:hypothetical protein H5410_023524 [Solanum commersonii]
MARKISNHDEGEQNEMIMRYLEEVKKKILLNISHYAKSDSSMRSETSEDMHEAQQYEEESPVDALKKAEDFLAKLKDKVKWSRKLEKNMTGRAYEMLTIDKSLLKFQDDLYNQKFLIKPMLSTVTKYMFDKDFKHDRLKRASSSIHPKIFRKVIHYMLNYGEFITQKRGDSFASIAKEEVDDIKTYER